MHKKPLKRHKYLKTMRSQYVMCINVKNGVKIILFLFNIFQIALDIIQNDEDPKPQNVKEY